MGVVLKAEYDQCVAIVLLQSQEHDKPIEDRDGYRGDEESPKPYGLYLKELI